MYGIEKDVNHLEAMLALDKIAKSHKDKTPARIGRFSYDEVESMERVIKVVGLLNELLNFMDRPIPCDEEE